MLKTDLFDELLGPGPMQALCARGVRLTGIDFSPAIVAAVARRHTSLEAHIADVRSLPFPADSFQAVFSGSTLDHFQCRSEIMAALAELARVLSPGGRLVLTLDNPRHPLLRLRAGRLYRVFRWLGVLPYEIGLTLDPCELVEALRSVGLDVAEITPVLHAPRVIAVALSGLTSVLGRSAHQGFLGLWPCFEFLEGWPTRWQTGHYIAAMAIKPAISGCAGNSRFPERS